MFVIVRLNKHQTLATTVSALSKTLVIFQTDLNATSAGVRFVLRQTRPSGSAARVTYGESPKFHTNLGGSPISTVQTPEETSFRYINVMDVDPSFQPIDAEVYNLRLTKAELRSYTDGKTGESKDRVALTFTVTAHPKYSGRKVFESLFPNNFSFIALHHLANASGIPQEGSMEDWLAQLTTTQPVVKMQVDVVQDGKTVNGTFVPNPRTAKADGTAANVNRINWRAGVQPGDVA